MQHKKQKNYRRFMRKPYNSDQQENEESFISREKSKGRSSSTLKLHQNTISMKIESSSQTQEDFLSQSLFSLDSTPIRSFCDVKGSQSKRSTFLKLQYSPDSLFMSTPQPNFDEQQILLLDTTEKYQSTNLKYETTTAISHSETCESRVSSNSPLCSIFSYQHHEEWTHPHAFKVSLITLTSYIVKIEYHREKKMRNSLEDNFLVRRMKKYFKEKPFNLFQFYQKVLKKCSSPNLRIFLLEKRIKFSTCQIEELQKWLLEQLKEKQFDEILEYLFFSIDTEDEMILNLSKEHFIDKINLPCKSLWQTFGAFMESQSFFNSMFSFEMGQFQSFLRELL